MTKWRLCVWPIDLVAAVCYFIFIQTTWPCRAASAVVCTDRRLLFPKKMAAHSLTQRTCLNWRKSASINGRQSVPGARLSMKRTLTSLSFHWKRQSDPALPFRLNQQKKSSASAEMADSPPLQRHLAVQTSLSD